MEEITIGDKIYISSKRAAKITGYAKDYVGQLCREGRVEAKLVGRNWYVLESSIREHRFGKEEVAPVQVVEQTEAPNLIQTWQKPQYESQVPVMVPELSPRGPVLEPVGTKAVADMQSAWREWFQDKNQMTLPSGEDDFKEEYLPVVLEEKVDEEVAEDKEEEVVLSRIQEPEVESNDGVENDEEEEVILHRSYDSREAGEQVPVTEVPVVDLTHRVSPRLENKPAKGNGGAIIVRSLLLVLAFVAAIISAFGTGYAERFLSGTSLNLGAQRQVIEFLGGTSTVEKGK
jgi:hypothetical protein